MNRANQSPTTYTSHVYFPNSQYTVDAEDPLATTHGIARVFGEMKINATVLWLRTNYAGQHKVSDLCERNWPTSVKFIIH